MPTPSVLFLIPPLTQLNTPYPSTAYLTGFLRGRGIEASQADSGIDMVLRLFSRSGLQTMFERVRERKDELPGEARQMLAIEPAYMNAIEPVIEFLQGRNPSLALLLARPGFLPKDLGLPAIEGALRHYEACRSRIALNDSLHCISKTWPIWSKRPSLPILP